MMIILFKFILKLPLTILEIIYIVSRYIAPIIPPFINPFFFIFLLAIELPINRLIAVITITTVGIVFSDIFVYVKSIANIHIFCFCWLTFAILLSYEFSNTINANGGIGDGINKNIGRMHVF